MLVQKTKDSNSDIGFHIAIAADLIESTASYKANYREKILIKFWIRIVNVQYSRNKLNSIEPN